MFNSPLLHLYYGKDFQDKIEFKHYMMNIVGIPILAIIFISIIKKYISVREFIYIKYKEAKNIKKKYKGKAQRFERYLKLHIVQTKLSKFRNENIKYSRKCLFSGLAVILYTGYNTTSFCLIYKNSLLCLTLNTLASMIFTILVLIIILLISTILRKISKCFKCKFFYILSGFLNPSCLFKHETWEIKEIASDEEDNENEENKEKTNKGKKKKEKKKEKKRKKKKYSEKYYD